MPVLILATWHWGRWTTQNILSISITKNNKTLKMYAIGVLQYKQTSSKLYNTWQNFINNLLHDNSTEIYSDILDSDFVIYCPAAKTRRRTICDITGLSWMKLLDTQTCLKVVSQQDLPCIVMINKLWRCHHQELSAVVLESPSRQPCVALTL